MYQYKHPFGDGSTHVVLEPLDFMYRMYGMPRAQGCARAAIARLAALVPIPRLNLTRFHGVFAPNCKHRARAYAASPHAQGQEQVEAMLKWGMAEVVHYDVVAEYSGQTMIPAFRDWVAVKDRFEISFDWSPTKLTLVGKPAFKNFPSTVPPRAFPGACQQPPPLSGGYEHFDIVDMKLESIGGLELTVKRTFPAGAIPVVGETGNCALRAVAAGTETMTHGVLIPQGINLVMPETAGENITVLKDGKTIVLDDKDNTLFGCPRLNSSLIHNNPRPVPGRRPTAAMPLPAATRLMAFLRERDIVTVADYFEPALREHLGEFVPEETRNFFAITSYYDPAPLYSHFWHWFVLARMDQEPDANPIRRGALLATGSIPISMSRWEMTGLLEK